MTDEPTYVRKLVWDYALEGYGWEDIDIILKQLGAYRPPRSYNRTMVELAQKQIAKQAIEADVAAAERQWGRT